MIIFTEPLIAVVTQVHSTSVLPHRSVTFLTLHWHVSFISPLTEGTHTAVIHQTSKKHQQNNTHKIRSRMTNPSLTVIADGANKPQPRHMSISMLHDAITLTQTLELSTMSTLRQLLDLYRASITSTDIIPRDRNSRMLCSSAHCHTDHKSSMYCKDNSSSLQTSQQGLSPCFSRHYTSSKEIKTSWRRNTSWMAFCFSFFFFPTPFRGGIL